MTRKITFFFLSVAALLTSCQPSTPTDKLPIHKGMIKVSILYPNGEGKTFDMDYYSTKHMPMLVDLFGDSLKHLAIDQGIAGRGPDEPIPFLAMGHLYFETLSAYQNSFGPHAEKIVGDIPNYTNVQPVVQISEVLK